MKVGGGLPRAPSALHQASRMETYEDEDYEEGFDEANENDGLDEMEKLKQAMNKEKAKAQKFNVLKGDGRDKSAIR